MAALERLSHFIGIDSKKFTREEILILEAELYTRVHEEIWELHKFQHKEYFYLFKLTNEMENMIMEIRTIRCLLFFPHEVSTHYRVFPIQ